MSQKNTCWLCGGRLYHGICTECGMDNRKSDDRYRMNTHNEETDFHDAGNCSSDLNKKSSAVMNQKSSAVPNKKAPARSIPVKMAPQKSTDKKKNHSSVTIAVIIVLYVILRYLL